MSNRKRSSQLAHLIFSGMFVALAACGGAQPTGSVCPTDSTLTYDNFGKQFMTDYCTDCHASTLSGSARDGAPLSRNYDTLTAIRNDLAGVDETIASGPDATNTSMPPSAPYPTAAERELLGEWIACGAP